MPTDQLASKINAYTEEGCLSFIWVKVASPMICQEYLPPYSPDFNLLEKKWAQAKAIRKYRSALAEGLRSFPYKGHILYSSD